MFQTIYGRLLSLNGDLVMIEPVQGHPVLEESKRLKGEHPADIARDIQGYPEEEAVALLEDLPIDVAAQAVEEMAPEIAAPLMLDLDSKLAGKILEEMHSDHAVDILQEFDVEEREKVLSEISALSVTELLRLLSYPEDSVGSIMSPDLTILSKDITVEEATLTLRKKREECEDLHYVYVVDGAGRLQGILYMRDLIFSSPSAKISDIMHAEVTTVRVDQDKEEAAQLLDRYHYLALPVVDSGNRLLGIVTVDSVIDVIQDEASEDLQIMVGAGGDERVYTPISFSFRKRLPWLWFNLAAAFVAASVIGLFKDIIAQVTILAVFFPIVANQGGNAGSQALAVIIRGIALGEVDVGRAWRVMRREIILGVINGAVIGVTASLIAYLISGNGMLGLVIGVAMFINLIVAGIMGALIPIGLKRLGLDPAQSSTIFLTIVSDMVGFFTFLGLAALLIQFL